MFDPAPEWSAQSNEQVKEALSFGNRVKCHAQKYVVFSEHRIFMIRKCCAYLETLMEDKKGLVWPNDQREPIEEFQNVMRILIYTICDDEFLFDGAGYFKAKPNTEKSQFCWMPSAWEQSVRAYHDFAFAMRRRNYAYMELKALRKHLEEHSKQNLNYQSHSSGKNSRLNGSVEVLKWALSAYIKACTRQSGTAITGFDPSSTETENFANLLNQIRQDRLLKKVSLLIILGVLSGAISADVADVSYLRAYLKPNRKIFNESNAAANCALFSAITKNFPRIEKDLFEQKYDLFDPYALLGSLSFINDLCLTDEDFVALAHLCEDCFDKPRKKAELLQYKQPVNGVPIGEVLRALFVLFDAQGYDVNDSKKPRGWSDAIRTLKQAKIIEDIAAKDGLNDDKAIERSAAYYLDMVKKKYPIEHFNFNWEVFWLITGYVPPPLFDWKSNYGGEGLIKKPFELYGICAEHLNDLCEAAIEYFIDDWDHPSLSPELRYDIAKVRRTFAELGNRPEKQKAFLTELELVIAKGKVFCSQSQLRQDIANFCLREYGNICSEKEKQLKSFKSYGNILGMAMADEAVKQLCADTYQRTFHLLASLNQYIWPITK